MNVMIVVMFEYFLFNHQTVKCMIESSQKVDQILLSPCSSSHKQRNCQNAYLSQLLSQFFFSVKLFDPAGKGESDVCTFSTFIEKRGCM
jgi:hypothetical protein